jgi:hypothetical protein
MRKKRRVNCEMGGVYLMTPTPMGQCNLEVEHVRVKLNHIHPRVIKLNTVRSLDTSTTERLQELLIIITLSGKVIETLIIVDPECYIPSLIILPTIVGDIECITLVGSSHLGFECSGGFFPSDMAKISGLATWWHILWPVHKLSIMSPDLSNLW